MLWLFLHHTLTYICNIIQFGAEGWFMPTWHDFEPEVKLRRSRKRPSKKLTNKDKKT